MSLIDKEYIQVLGDLKDKIKLAKSKAALSVNKEMLFVYWQIGETILTQQKKAGWGAKIIDRLSGDLKTEFPDFKGLSVRNLKYMRAFAEAYPKFGIVQDQLAQIELTTQNEHEPIVQATLAQITWTHHIALLDKVKDPEIRNFYILKTIENGWKRDMMVLQIENNLYQRQGSAITNFTSTLPKEQSELAKQTLKSPYVFDFLALEEKMQERQLEQGLIEHLKNFMLELGKGFAYIGNQKNLVVEGDDFFLDLLFYNYHLHCFVVFELKIGEFKPEFAGKLNFYVNTVDAQLKSKVDKPTIGVLLCKTPNETVVKYALQGIDTPIGVSDYKLAKALPSQLKGEIPTVAELEKEVEESYEELKTPTQKRFDHLKEAISQLKGSEVKQTATTSILFDIIDKSLVPLYKSLLARFEEFTPMFFSKNYHWQGTESNITELAKLAKEWKDEKFLKSANEFHFNYRLNGLKKGGADAFDIHYRLNFRIDTYSYGFSIINYNNQEVFFKKLYHEQLTPEDIAYLTDLAADIIMDSIESRLKFLKNESNE